MSAMELENAAFSEEENHMEGDDEAPLATAESSAAVVVSPDKQKSERFSPQLLQMYYARLFPYSFLYDWLSYGNDTSLLSRREFSFTIEPVRGQEIYLRYQSFATQQALAEGICKRCPTKIDIGAVFAASPKDKHAIQTKKVGPVQRELVFDIDLTDYDQVRYCGCEGANICGICWGYMKMAVQVVDAGLRQDFGFEQIAWFYSGRRGIHAWVCDETARLLTDEGRSAVAKYFDVDLGSDQNTQVTLPHPLHPSLSRAFAALEPMFIQQVLPASGHGLLATSEKWGEFLKLLPDSAARVREELSARWAKKTSTPEAKWDEFKRHLTNFLKAQKKNAANKAAKNMSSKDRARLENLPVEIVFRYGYPRLDINVSKMRNHLLKSPFCVHPKTGRVCVPIRDVSTFDPFAVPTLDELVDELDAHHKKGSIHVDEDDEEQQQEEKSTNQKGAKKEEWKNTSLRKYFEPFQKEFLDPMVRAQRRKERDEAEQRAAAAGDF